MNSDVKHKKNIRFVALKIWELLFIKKNKLSDIFRNDKSFNSLNSKDRSFIYFLIHLALRNHNQIKFFLKKFIKKQVSKNLYFLDGILLLGTAEIIWSRTPHYAVLNSYVDLSKILCGVKYSGFINAVLQNIVRQKDNLSSSNWDIKNNYPKWMLNSWEKQYGKIKTTKMLKVLNKEPYLDIICSKKMNIEMKNNLIKFLDGHEIHPNVIRSNYKGKINDILYFNKGIWWVQDLSSYLHIEYLLKFLKKINKNNEFLKISDICAAPGGKTFQLLDNGYEIVSNDINKKRLNIMSDNLKRLNFKSKLISVDGRTYKFPEKQDIIIIDAPCSSTGTIRKNPDILIRNNIIDLTKLQRIQQELLKNAASNIKVGGYLMYIVCSLEKEEGEDIVNKFLKTNTNFQILNLNQYIQDLKTTLKLNTMGYLKFLPIDFKVHQSDHLNGNNGFFSAIIERKF